MNRLLALILLACALALPALPAGADPGARDAAQSAGVDAAGACQIEDWRWYHSLFMNTLWIEGSTACTGGEITIRAYDGSGQFLGMATAYIDGYAFQATITNVHPVPNSVNIKTFHTSED